MTTPITSPSPQTNLTDLVRPKSPREVREKDIKNDKAKVEKFTERQYKEKVEQSRLGNKTRAAIVDSQLSKADKIHSQRLATNGEEALDPSIPTLEETKLLQEFNKLAQPTLESIPPKPDLSSEAFLKTLNRDPSIEAKRKELLVNNNKKNVGNSFVGFDTSSIQDVIEELTDGEPTIQYSEYQKKYANLNQKSKETVKELQENNLQQSHIANTRIAEQRAENIAETKKERMKIIQESGGRSKGLGNIGANGQRETPTSQSIDPKDSLVKASRPALTELLFEKNIERDNSKDKDIARFARIREFLKDLAASKDKIVRYEPQEPIAMKLIAKILDKRQTAKFDAFSMEAAYSEQKTITVDEVLTPIELREKLLSVEAFKVAKDDERRSADDKEISNPNDKYVDLIRDTIDAAEKKEALSEQIINKDNIVTRKTEEDRRFERVAKIKNAKTQQAPLEKRAEIRRDFLGKREELSVRERIISYKEEVNEKERLTSKEKALFPVTKAASAIPEPEAKKDEVTYKERSLKVTVARKIVKEAHDFQHNLVEKLLNEELFTKEKFDEQLIEKQQLNEFA